MPKPILSKKSTVKLDIPQNNLNEKSIDKNVKIIEEKKVEESERSSSGNSEMKSSKNDSDVIPDDED